MEMNKREIKALKDYFFSHTRRGISNEGYKALKKFYKDFKKKDFSNIIFEERVMVHTGKKVAIIVNIREINNMLPTCEDLESLGVVVGIDLY